MTVLMELLSLLRFGDPDWLQVCHRIRHPEWTMYYGANAVAV